MTIALKKHRLVTTRKLNDRFLACQINSFEHENSEAGCIFSLVEILSPWFPNTQIGQTLINTVNREYFRAKESPANNFEYALKRANEVLAHYTQTGETEWIGKINAIFALVYNQEMHVTAVGEPYAFLLREGKLINILSELLVNGSDVHPLNTFTNLTSATLEVNDVIIFTSSGLQEYYTPNELQPIIEVNPLPEAALEVTNKIRQKGVNNVNAIFIEVSTKEDIANEPVSDIPETIFLDDANEPLLAKLKQATKKYLPTRTPKTENTSQAINEPSMPRFDEPNLPNKKSRMPWLNNAGSKIKKIISRPKTDLPLETTPNLERPKIEVVNEQLPPIIGASYHVRHYGRPGFKSRLGQVSNPIGQIFKKLASYIGQLFVNPQLRPRLYRYLIVLLGIILVGSIIYKVRQAKPTANTKPVVEISALKSQYQSALSLEPAQAIPKLQNILKSLNQNENLEDESKTLFYQTQTRLDTLTHTTRLTTPPKTIDLPADYKGYVVIDNKIFTFDIDGNIYRTNQNNSSFSRFAELPANAGEITTVFGPTAKKTILILTNKPQLYELAPSSSQVKTVSADPKTTWHKAIALTGFNNNIYLLDKQAGQIWKYLLSAGKYQNGTAYTSNTQAQLKDALSFAIDGNVFVLRKDASVIKLTLTKLAQIKFTGYPDTKNQTLKNPKKIITNEDNDYLFVLEPKRLVQFSKTGAYIKEYKLAENNSDIEDIFIQTDPQKLWLSVDNALFSSSY